MVLSGFEPDLNIAENNRLRKKANDLRKKPGYENKEGKVMVDNVVVDKNIFFH